MRKKFYVEPEIEINTFNFKSDVRTVNGGLDVSETPDNEGDFDGEGDLWGDVY